MVSGKLELTVKINELPQAETVENGWQQFEIDCGDHILTVVVKPKPDAAVVQKGWSVEEQKRLIRAC